MDYWKDLDVTTYIDYADFLEKNPGAKIYMATTKAKKTYTEVAYEPDCYIMFGKESAGIPEEILVENQETAIRIPMINDIQAARSGATLFRLPHRFCLYFRCLPEFPAQRARYSALPLSAALFFQSLHEICHAVQCFLKIFQ